MSLLAARKAAKDVGQFWAWPAHFAESVLTPGGGISKSCWLEADPCERLPDWQTCRSRPSTAIGRAVKLMPLRLRNGTQRKCLSGSSVCTTHGDKPCRLMRATSMEFLRSKRTTCWHWFHNRVRKGALLSHWVLHPTRFREKEPGLPRNYPTHTRCFLRCCPCETGTFFVPRLTPVEL